MNISTRRHAIRIPGLALAGALAIATQARAQWVERPFAPPVGSHWIVKSEQTTEVTNNGRASTTHQTMTADLTFTDKTAEGYRIVYVLRAVDSDMPNQSVIDFTRQALQDRTIRATIDAKGMPLRIDNIDEIHAAVGAAIDRMLAPLAGTPRGNAERQILATIYLGNATRGMPYLPGLSLLAAGQDTGLHPGETRTEADELPNPLGGPPLKANGTLRMESADAAGGGVHLVRTQTYDPAALKELTRLLVQRFAGNNPAILDKMLSGANIDFKNRAELTVEGGMTRRLDQEDTMTTTIAGHQALRHTRAIITVTPAS
jgi:hypothetical protein